MAGMQAAGVGLRSKSVAAYRAAANDAELVNVPDVLRKLVDAIVAFGTSAGN